MKHLNRYGNMRKMTTGMYQFAMAFAGLIMGVPAVGYSYAGNVPSAKSLRSKTLVLDLKASAALKRERKAKKRASDNEACMFNNPCLN